MTPFPAFPAVPGNGESRSRFASRSRERGNGDVNEINGLAFPFPAFPKKSGTAQVIEIIEITGFPAFPYYVGRCKGVSGTLLTPPNDYQKSRAAAISQNGAAA
ncbi:hypothetical protein [Bosea minatitlanensis]|uniref:Uncharacterized protein n=1 Tax=Bosea minatitlanensis TaxID=128782 RepID=A0ABW0F0Q7_9HYPH|nr:hypothetical protein [Bosea minatitlanensis]MCT4495444.1 hypothetical protein [Bosea minatitlanensis]